LLEPSVAEANENTAASFVFCLPMLTDWCLLRIAFLGLFCFERMRAALLTHLPAVTVTMASTVQPTLPE
jgi:hypothetical protein